MIDKYIAFRFYIEVVGTIAGTITIIVVETWYLIKKIKIKNKYRGKKNESGRSNEGNRRA